jgi:hypothetical protein
MVSGVTTIPSNNGHQIKNVFDFFLRAGARRFFTAVGDMG